MTFHYSTVRYGQLQYIAFHSIAHHPLDGIAHEQREPHAAAQQQRRRQRLVRRGRGRAALGAPAEPAVAAAERAPVHPSRGPRARRIIIRSESGVS